MTDTSLKGKTAVVTGASSGIGQVIAEALGSAGAHVFMCGRATQGMEGSREKIEAAGGGATLSAFDMKDLVAVDAMIKKAAAHGDRLDIMVNNAGLGFQTPITEADPDEWRQMVDVNILGLLMGCQSAVREMRATGSKGQIINISSIAALRRDSGVYGATKHAVNCINASLRGELEDDDIRVTSIMPGVFGTNFVRNFNPEMVNGIMEAVGMTDVQPGNDGKYPREALEEVQDKMGVVVGNPKDIADAVLYLVNQPTSINIEELVIRPPKSLDF